MSNYIEGILNSVKKNSILRSCNVVDVRLFMAPLALIGPATSGFSTASIIQSTVTASGNYLVKKSTGKTVTEHAMDALNEINMKQSYFPSEIIAESASEKDINNSF